MTADPEWDYAFCAPGGKPLAALTLLLSGDEAPEIREHPYLTGLEPGQVILMRDPWTVEPPFPPFAGVDDAAGHPVTTAAPPAAEGEEAARMPGIVTAALATAAAIAATALDHWDIARCWPILAMVALGWAYQSCLWAAGRRRHGRR